MNQFATTYEPIETDGTAFGQAAQLPWDSDYFGFSVGAYQPAAQREPPEDVRALKSALIQWMQRRSIKLLSASVAADSIRWMGCLGAIGFQFVDLSLMAFARRLSNLPPPRIPVRQALPADAVELERISGEAFSFGRYHSDPRFPKQLADGRYRRWMRNALGAQGGCEFVIVSGPAGTPTGFVHARIQDREADLRLAAVDVRANSGIMGLNLFLSALHFLRQCGAQTARARLSAANVSVLNVYSSLGFAFRNPEAIYHIHAASMNPERLAET